MLAELAQPSRADGYERWAHLLMAQAAGQPAGRDKATLPDILGDGTPVSVPLDAALTAVQNAERYYDRARRSRRARAEAEARWETVQSAADTTEHLLARLRGVEGVAALQAFLADEAEALGRVIRSEAQGGTAEPFRRIALPGGAEALVGKNAKGNAVLTTQVAQPHDYWLHARGVPGSHVIVRRPSRTWEAPPAVLDAAARVAAYYSTARSQPLAPVTVTERKYVRPVKGGAPGLVRVDREEVRIVEPGLPGRGGA
jgi:predicted ribosome quality control (RQC) complex YloA/Tae2 family protein